MARIPRSRQWVTWACLGLFLVAIYMVNRSSNQESSPTSAQSSMLTRRHGVSDEMYRFAVLPSSAGDNPSYYHTHMKAVLEGCGDICRVDMTGEPSLYFDHIRKDVDCHALITNAAIDAAMTDDEPPQQVPPEMVDAFTYGGKVALVPYFGGLLNQRYMGGEAFTSTWTEELINDWKAECGKRELGGTYGVDTTNQLVDALHHVNIQGASVLVIGSEQPWVEACALSLGAKEVTTLEYGGIQSTHPQVKTLTPEKMRLSAGTFLNRFDAVITYSSVEHSGLGRYGDALNPWGDRQAIARAWCMTKPGGRIAVGVPHNTVDTIHYNAHREYGPVQLPHLLANWKQIWMTEEAAYQKVWVCEK